MKLYHKGRWPDPAIPDGEPEWLLYETDATTDCVLRTVDIFPDGKAVRNWLANEGRHGPPVASLVEGDFLANVGEWRLMEIDGPAFEALWQSAADKHA